MIKFTLHIIMFSIFRSFYLVHASKHRTFRALSMVSRRLPYPTKPTTNDILKNEQQRISGFMKFVDSSPDPFHAVATASAQLLGAGFQHIDESVSWGKGEKLKRGGRYFFTRGGSTIVAFVIGSKYQPGNGFKLIGAHTDSPTLKIKPCSKRKNSKIIQLNVETYGLGLWHSWFDRDLSIAGRVILRRDSETGEDSYATTLVHIQRPVLRIPNLCVHLRSPDERESFKVNNEDHLAPILCDEVEKAFGSNHDELTINSTTGSAESLEYNNANSSNPIASDWANSQQHELLTLLSGELNCTEDEIVDFELSIYDVQPASQSGLNREWICSGRIDNLASCYVALDVLTEYAVDANAIGIDGDVSIVALFDHEEVGSGSTVGAGSALMRDSLERIHLAFVDPADGSSSLDHNELFKMSLMKSMIFSVDMAHAVHPNYASKHDKAHAPHMNGGVVIKTNVNQRYATGGVTGFFVRELARRAGVPVQEFSVRNDCPCGSTIGPIISQNTGVRAVDLGMPQLSMHSVREIMGAADLTHAHRLFLTFLRSFRELDSALR